MVRMFSNQYVDKKIVLLTCYGKARLEHLTRDFQEISLTRLYHFSSRCIFKQGFFVNGISATPIGTL